MRTGEFKHLIKFLRNVPSQDPANGDMISLESTLTEMWAKVSPMTGSRAFNAGQVLNGKPYEILIRYRDDMSIDEDLIIDWNGKRLAIHSVVDEDAAATVMRILAYQVR